MYDFLSLKFEKKLMNCFCLFTGKQENFDLQSSLDPFCWISKDDSYTHPSC